MTTPTNCTACGHGLGIGRFCTNCGQPVPGRHPGAVPPGALPPPPPSPAPTSPAPPATVGVPVVPPPPGQVPPAARYPLFADTVPPGPPPQDPPSPAAYQPPPGSAQPKARWLPWAAGVGAVAVIGVIGAVVMVNAGGDDAVPDRSRAGSTSSSSTPTSQSTPSSSVTPAQPPDQDPSPTGPATPGQDSPLSFAGPPQVPAVAPESRDANNQPVSFGPQNLTDGDPRTAWRMPGDGTGQAITIDLGAMSRVTEVSLINGYAKIDGPNDWYRANRQITRAEWHFDDGSVVTQELRQTTDLQPVGVPGAQTRMVRLVLVSVGPPAPGEAGRDFTAISELQVIGVRD